VAVNAPKAAPRVFNAYRVPMVVAAVSILVVSARARRGRDIPIKMVGHRRLMKSTAVIAHEPSPRPPSR